MPDSSLPVPSLSRAREEKISELSTHFANDDLSLEDLERRIERVYKAASVAELEEITADLRRAVTSNAPVPVGKSSRMKVSGTKYELASARLLSLMSSTRRVGRWAVPQKLDLVAIMSDTKLDFTHAAMPGGIVNVHIRAIMASCKLVVPPNVRVVNETHSVMSTVRSRADELSSDGVSAPGDAVIRLTGVAFMSDVRIVVRRREEPVYDDDDDDDDD
jgi:hypothetical protein